jgi:simple sugar transport system permease protein
MAIVVTIGTGLGLAMGALIHCFRIAPFIVTLAGMFFARGLGFIIQIESLPIQNPFYRSITSWGLPIGWQLEIPLVALVFLGVLGVAIFLSSWTAFGRNVYAIGGNEEAAVLMGVPVARTKLLVYSLSGFCSALAGVVFTVYGSSGNPSAGVGMELDAIAAVVVGGTLLSGGVGSVFGTLIGVLIFGIIQTGISFQGTLSSWWTRVAIGVLLLLFILLQKLFARPSRAAEAAP